MRLPFSPYRKNGFFTHGLAALLSASYLSGCMVAKGYSEKEH